MSETVRNGQFLYLNEPKHFTQPSIVEGVIQYRIPIALDTPDLNTKPHVKHLSGKTSSELVDYWNHKAAKAIASSEYVKSQRKLPAHFFSHEVGGDATIFDFHFFLRTAETLRFIEKSEMEDLRLLVERGSVNPLSALMSNPRIFEVIDRLHHLCFYLRFASVAFSHQLIGENENTEITQSLLSQDITQASANTYQEIVSGLLNREPNESTRFTTIRARLERLPIRIGDTVADASHQSTVKAKLDEIYEDQKRVVAPSELRNPGPYIRLVDYEMLNGLNNPEIIIEVLNEIRSYSAPPQPGNVIKTHSLFPGEKAVITVETFRKENQTISQTTSIVDETSEEAERSLANEANFENSFNNERSRESSYSSGVSAKASWGWGSAGGSYNASSKGKSVAKRATKNVSKALRRQVAKVSNNRSINVETSSTKNLEESQRSSIVRTIENINVSTPLNFFFRQLTQTSISLISMTDCRILIHPSLEADPIATSLEAFPDVFRARFFDPQTDTSDAYTAELYQSIVDVLNGFGQVSDSETDLILPADDIEDPEIPRFEFSQKLGGNFEPPEGLGLPDNLPYEGLLTSVDTTTMKTEGVHVDCAISEDSKGLDEYSKTLQQESGNAAAIKNSKDALISTMYEEGLKLLKDTPDPASKSDIFKEILIPIIEAGKSSSNEG